MKKACSTCLGLLAVLGFLVVTAAIMFPILASSHREPWQMICMSNEKQLGLAILQYAQDNDNNMPDIADARDPNATWRTMIFPYSKSNGMFQCPSRDDKFNGPDGIPRSYAANYTGTYSGKENDQGNGAFAGPGSKPIHLQDIKHPESLIVMCEVWHSDRPEFNIDNLGAFHPNSDILWAGHTDASNYLLADGHVIYLKPLATKGWWHRNASIPLSLGALKVLGNSHKAEGK